MNALDQIKQCLETKQDFVLQGGAGSGKTETLKETLEYIGRSQPKANVACITLTNKAAEEIKNRIGEIYHISTIHSFLHSLIDSFRSNIRIVLPVVFLMESLIVVGEDEGEIIYDVYKKRYEKFAALSYRFGKVKVAKLVGKVEYDKKSRIYASKLSVGIAKLNDEISLAIANADLQKIIYNESSYDNIRNFSYGHNGLLKVAAALIERFPTLQRILSDRFDYIFVDEYQDTSPAIVRVLIDIIAKTTKTTIGMFGDSMQGIYKDGVGDVDRYIEAGALRKIEKEDNFRCAEQVVKFLNALRLDTLRQEVALKFRADGGMESLAERQGSVTLIYSIAPEGAKKDKSTYLPKLRRLIEAANHSGQAKYLMLTNKAIAGEVGFPQLYEIFTGRYGQERGDQMERVLNVLQFDELVRLCALYRDKEYNELINRVKQNGFQINSKKDKENLHSNIEAIAKSNLSAVETMEAAVRSGLIAPSETHRGFVEYKNEFLADLEKDEAFQTFLCDKAEGNNTVIRMIKAGRAMDEYLFDDLSKKDKKRTFYQDLFSNAAKFVEVLNYFDYMNDEKPYVTMHKTKGTGIPEVVVVLDEYYWREHEFKNILTSDFGEAQNMNRKLVYVACSRAINHLTCVRIISSDEEKALLAADFCSIHKFDYEKL